LGSLVEKLKPFYRGLNTDELTGRVIYKGEVLGKRALPGPLSLSYVWEIMSGTEANNKNIDPITLYGITMTDGRYERAYFMEHITGSPSVGDNVRVWLDKSAKLQTKVSAEGKTPDGHTEKLTGKIDWCFMYEIQTK